MGLKQELDRELEGFAPSELWAEIESRATRPGPTELPAPDGGSGGLPRKRLVAAVVALVVFLGALALLWSAFRAAPPRPAEPSPGPRQNGELIQFADIAGSSGLYLAAQDPGTGQLRLFADTSAIIDCGYVRGPCHTAPALAAWSADGRWVAFDVFCSGGDPGSCRRRGGLWVVGAGGEPRQVAGPCESCHPENVVSHVWAWGPAGTGVAYTYLHSSRGRGCRAPCESELFVFDPSDGTRRSLGRVNGQITALSWTPDGTRISFAVGGALYLVDPGSGERTRIATYEGVVGGLWGWPGGIKWSPDGTKIALETVREADGTWGVRVLDAEGSELFVLPVPGGGPFQEYPEVTWSPDGTQIAYTTYVFYAKERGSGSGYSGQIRAVASDASNATFVFDPGFRLSLSLRPTWSPDGSRLAFTVGRRGGRPTQWLVVDLGEIGEPQPIDELTVQSWRGGSFASGGGWTPGHLGVTSASASSR